MLSLHLKIIEIGGALSEEEFASILFVSLPQSYNPTISILSLETNVFGKPFQLNKIITEELEEQQKKEL